jgi:hypothetical protein
MRLSYRQYNTSDGVSDMKFINVAQMRMSNVMEKLLIKSQERWNGKRLFCRGCDEHQSGEQSDEE